MAPFCFSKQVGLWWWHQLVRHLHLDLSSHIKVNIFNTQCPTETTPSSIFPTLLSLLLSQTQGLNCPPYFPVSSMEPSPEDSTLAMFCDSVPHFKIHSQHRSARLHYPLKNKLKQTLFHDLFYDLLKKLCLMIMILNHNQCKWIWKINTSYTQHSEKTISRWCFYFQDFCTCS